MASTGEFRHSEAFPWWQITRIYCTSPSEMSIGDWTYTPDDDYFLLGASGSGYVDWTGSAEIEWVNSTGYNQNHIYVPNDYPVSLNDAWLIFWDGTRNRFVGRMNVVADAGTLTNSESVEIPPSGLILT